MGSWKDSVPSYIRSFIEVHVRELSQAKMSFIADNCNIIIKHCNFILCFNSSKRDSDFIEEHFIKSPNTFAVSSGTITLYEDVSIAINIIGFFSEQEKDAFIRKFFDLNKACKIDKIEFLDICKEYVQNFEIGHGKLKLCTTW